MENLALTYSDQARWKEALVQVKEACLRLYGAEHTETVMTLESLVNVPASRTRKGGKAASSSDRS